MRQWPAPRRREVAGAGISARGQAAQMRESSRTFFESEEQLGIDSHRLLALGRMQPADRFNVIRFNDTTDAVFAGALPATPLTADSSRSTSRPSSRSNPIGL